MAIRKEITRLEKSNVNLSITVPKEDADAQYKDMLKEYTKTIQIPGFRKGHVPQEVLERKFADALKQEAAARIIENALHEVLDDKELPRSDKPLPYASPELQGEPKLEFGKDFQFSVVYDVLPEVKVKQWKGLKIEHPYAEVGQEDIDRELEAIRERNSIVMDCEDGAAAKEGHVVTIDYEIFDEDGNVPQDMQRNDFAFTLGSNKHFHPFDESIIGMKKGETKEFDKRFPDDYFEAALAGKTRKVKITLTSLKEKKLPDLDDDLAQDVDEKFKTLDDLKNNIKEKLEKNLDRRLRDVKVSELMKKIMENTPVTLPESMIKAEVEGRWRRLARYYNTDPEMMIQMMKSGNGHEEREKEWRETAEKALHSRIIMETLIEEQKFDVSDEDIEKEFEKIASESGTTAEEVKKHYDEQAAEYLKEEIKERRLIDMMFAENTLKQGKKENYLDFISENG